MTGPVMAHGAWKTNGEMIAAAAQLGYVGDRVLDMTYGLGGWWTEHKPPDLVTVDCDPGKGSQWVGDFRQLSMFKPGRFDTIAFDPPYKLNGAVDHKLDRRYGVDVPDTVAGRHRLMIDGLTEAARLAGPGCWVLAKCQDQVAGGKVHWQTDMLSEVARVHGLTKWDRLQLASYRAQPKGRRQLHARNNFSTLLVFRRDP